MSWIAIGSPGELKEKRVVTVRGRDRQIAVFWNGGDIQAVDNRCPHMGFPLDQGSVQDGILTCHWHHARFALKGGCTFDLFADDVPTFTVREKAGQLEVSDVPNTAADVDYYRSRLRRGLEQNISLVQAKSIIGLLKAGVPALDILRELVDFGVVNHEAWRDGMTLITLMARLDPVLSEQTRIHGITWAARQIAANCNGQPRRRERGPLDRADESLERLMDWFSQFVLMRHRDGAERALLTASQACRDEADLQRVLAAAILQRVYLDSGHLYDFTNKALELGSLLDARDSNLWDKLLPLLVPEAVEGQGEEDRGAWRHPIDLVKAVKAAEEELKQVTPGTDPVPDGFRDVLLGKESEPILAFLVDSLKSGTDPVQLAREIALAAAWRLAHFSPSNELGDWFDPVHTFTYANAVVQSLQRAPVPELYPALLHGAMAVFQDRFLNIPPGAYPEASSKRPEEETRYTERLLAAMDRVPNPREVVELIVEWVRQGGSSAEITNCLSWAAIREDLDFHKLQVIEAAYQLSHDTADAKGRALLFAGAARYLSAHCPTARARQQPVRSALKLHRSG